MYAKLFDQIIEFELDDIGIVGMSFSLEKNVEVDKNSEIQKQLTEYENGKRKVFELPLHLIGTDFNFWVDRMEYASKLYDIVRIDHFRAFETYWKIPVSCETAMEGEWIEAPGKLFFDFLLKKHPDMQIIAEDLGLPRKEVYELRDHFNFKGMKIVQFTFDPNETNNNFEFIMLL